MNKKQTLLSLTGEQTFHLIRVTDFTKRIYWY